MVVAERIHQNVQKLPMPLQVEVLDFVEYLLLKWERETAHEVDTDEPNLSLMLAMRGMEDEDGPSYTPDDLKVVFS